MTLKTLTIGIPAYNEAATIGTVLTRIGKVQLIEEMTKEIIVVDDCSNGETTSLVKGHQPATGNSVRYMRTAVNSGKGFSIRQGIQGASGDFIIIQDAGLEYDPRGISYYGRTYAEGKKINWKDGVRAIFCILKYSTWSR